MEPLGLLAIAASLFALLHLWFVPLLQNTWEDASVSKKIGKAGALAGIEKLRDISGAASAALGLLVLTIWAMEALSVRDNGVAQGLIENFSGAYQWVRNMADSYASTLLWVGILGSALGLYLVVKNAKSTVIGVWTERAQSVFERIQNDPNLLNSYAEDAEISKIIEQISIRLHVLSELDAEQPGAQSAEKAEVSHELSSLFQLAAMEIASRELAAEGALNVSSLQNKEGENQRKPAPFIFRMFASKQFAKDIGLMSRPLSVAVTFLLVFSLVGWAAEPLANSMRLALNNLEVQSLAENVERELDTAVSEVKVDPRHEYTGFDQLDSASRIAQVSEQIARITLEQMSRSGVLERSIGVQPTTQSRSEFVRSAILQQELKPSSSRAGVVRSATSEIVGSNSALGLQEAALEEIKKEIAPKLETLENRDPRLLSKLKAQLEIRYGQPMGVLDAQGNLISRIVGQSLDPLPGSLKNELAKQAADVAKEIGENAVKKWATSYSNDIVKNALIDQARAGVAANMSEFDFKLAANSESLVNQLLASYGQNWGDSQVELRESRIAARVAENVASNFPLAERSAIIRNLGGYSEIFPSVAQAVAEGLVNDSGGGKPAKAVSTNFKMASRSFRVRGVLFGQHLEADDINITDLQWRFLDIGDVTLSVTENGAIKHLGRYNAGILNQALRYAADQRVVATTITPGDGEIVSRVTYLHPVLSDTPLGCRVIEADRFVDELTFGSRDSRLMEIIDDRESIFAWLTLNKLAEAFSTGEYACDPLKLQSAVSNLPTMSPALSSRIEAFVDEKLVGDASKKLVQSTLSCAAGSSQSLGACMCDAFKGGSLPLKYWFPEDHTSQYREAQSKLDSGFEFMSASSNYLGHVDLWLHTTFAVRSRFYGGADESTAIAMDFPESQLSSLNQILKNELIPEYLEAELRMSAKAFLEPLEQFTVLQRFMRAALTGQLGENFPLTTLIQLERETNEYVGQQPTIRWEPNENSLSEFFKVMRDSGDAHKLFEDYRNDRSARDEKGLPICAPISTN